MRSNAIRFNEEEIKAFDDEPRHRIPSMAEQSRINANAVRKNSQNRRNGLESQIN